MALLSPLRRAAIICAGEPSEPSKSEPYAVVMAFQTALKAAPGAAKKFLSAANTSRSVSTITSEPTMRAVNIASAGVTSGCRMRRQRAGAAAGGGADTAWVKVSPPGPPNEFGGWHRGNLLKQVVVCTCALERTSQCQPGNSF